VGLYPIQQQGKSAEEWKCWRKFKRISVGTGMPNGTSLPTSSNTISDELSIVKSLDSTKTSYLAGDAIASYCQRNIPVPNHATTSSTSNNKKIFEKLFLLTLLFLFVETFCIKKFKFSSRGKKFKNAKINKK